MNNHAASEGVRFFPSSINSSVYRQTSQYCVAIATCAGVATVFVAQAYHSKDLLFTPGQVAASMTTGEKSISIRSVWPPNSSLWVARLLELCNQGSEDAALKEISLATNDFKSSKNFQQLVDDFSRLNSAKLPDIILIGLLRNTYSIRAHIPIWDAFLARTEQILISHQKNHRALLRGLRSHY
jgi:hypothetical protein